MVRVGKVITDVLTTRGATALATVCMFFRLFFYFLVCVKSLCKCSVCFMWGEGETFFISAYPAGDAIIFRVMSPVALLEASD